jgi:hypothetical protein
MAVVYRPWISPYSDDDFEWNRKKSHDTFADRNFVFEAARIVFRGPLVRRPDARRRYKEPRFIGTRRVVRTGGGDYLYAAQPKMPDHFDATVKRIEQQIYYEHTAG